MALDERITFSELHTYVHEGPKDTLFHDLAAYAIKPVERVKYRKLLVY